jgi:hypothetical protein
MLDSSTSRRDPMAHADAGRRQAVVLPQLDRDEFDYYLDWAHRLGMIYHWPVFECELHAAATVALGLHEIPADLDDVQAAWVGDVHRRLSLQLLEAQSTFDPATSWEDFLERLWSGCQQLAYDPPTDSGRLTASLEREPPMLDDHDEPGIPLRLVPWLERMQFQRSVTDTYRAQRPDDWPLFHDALYQALSAEFGLDCTWANRDPRSEDTRLDDHHRRLTQLLDQARRRFDPAAHWEEFREIVWGGRDLEPTPTRTTEHNGDADDGDAGVRGER